MKAHSAARGLPTFTIGLPHRLTEIGEEYLEGLTAVSSFYDDPNSSILKHNREILKKHFPFDELNFSSARAMESMEILLSVIRKVGSADATAVRDEIRNGSYTGLNYQIQFDSETGDLTHATPFFLNHYGRWLDLTNPAIFVRPTVILVGTLVLFVIVYVVCARMLRLPWRFAALVAVLPLTLLLYVADSANWTSIGETLSKATRFCMWFGAVATVVTFILNSVELWGRRGPARGNHG